MGKLKNDPGHAGGPKSRGADAYGALKDAIRDNMFAPGHHLSEQEIALRLRMSRTPVHEALVRLQEEGLVRVLPKRGVLIVPLSPEDMREIYQVIITLESAAAGLLASLPPGDRRAALAPIVRAHDDMDVALASGSLDTWAHADDTFHRAMFDGCGNARLARMAYTILDQSHRARMATLRLRSRPDGSSVEHAAIIDAIQSGDPKAAANAAETHRSRASQELLPLLAHLKMKVL